MSNVRQPQGHPKSAAKIFAFIFVTQQQAFWVYHMGSYANNPLMLRSSKPMLMRDIFLTKCSAPFANPLSTLYVPYTWDVVWNCTYAWLLGMAVTPVVGFANMCACFFLGGFVSGMAYLFQCQLNPKRLNTPYDCNASSNGGFCAVAALGTMIRPSATTKNKYVRFPSVFSPLPIAQVSWLYIAQALAQEYFPPLRDWYPAMPMVAYTQTGKEAEMRTIKQRDQHARLTNWGCVGGLFFGLMYGTMMMRFRADRHSVSSIFESIGKHGVKT